MKKFILVAILISLVFVCGCSMLSYQDSKREIQMERAYKTLTSGDEAAIKAVKLDGGAGIGIDITKMEALTKHPVRQLGAAVLDAGLLYGAYLGIEEINSSSSSSDAKSVDVSGDNNTVIFNSGDNNTQTHDESESSTTN